MQPWFFTPSRRPHLRAVFSGKRIRTNRQPVATQGFSDLSLLCHKGIPSPQGWWNKMSQSASSRTWWVMPPLSPQRNIPMCWTMKSARPSTEWAVSCREQRNQRGTRHSREDFFWQKNRTATKLQQSKLHWKPPGIYSLLLHIFLTSEKIPTATNLREKNGKRKPAKRLAMRVFGCGERIWTSDLRVMSPTSYRTAPPRGI